MGPYSKISDLFQLMIILREPGIEMPTSVNPCRLSRYQHCLVLRRNAVNGEYMYMRSYLSA